MSLLPPPEILRLVEGQRVRVFPLAYRTNYQPCIKDNLKLASSDPAQIHAWAREHQNCNWGLATGPESNRVVIDVDAGGENGHARVGMASLDALLQAHGQQWLETPTVRTAGQGLHFHFTWPTGVNKITSSVSVLGDGIDVRASGAFACLPPSTVLLRDQTEADYLWEQGDETTLPGALPDWLLRKLLDTAPPSIKPQSGQNENGKVLQGARNVTLFKYACSLRSQGKERDEILALCRRENESRYQPPLEDKEVLKHVNSTMKYPAGNKVVVTIDHPIQSDPAVQPSLIKTLAEYLAETPEKPEWVVTGLAARGAMTNLDAKIKTGKSTLLLALTKAVLCNEPFLGLQTVAGAVLFMTEQPSSSFRPALVRAGLQANNNLHILSLQDTRGLSWEAVLALVSDYCAQKTAISVLILDTVFAWCGLTEGAENDSGAVLTALRPLQALLSQRLAIINSLHSRKSAGEVGDSARGSSALGGAADILATLSRLPGNPKNMRQLQTRSRFEETPEELVIMLEDGAYTVRGTPDSLAQEADRNWIEDNLPTTADDAMSLSELLVATNMPRGTLRRLLVHPCVIRTGDGNKLSPFRYHRAVQRKVTLGGKFII